jgi:hypothetical protein
MPLPPSAQPADSCGLGSNPIARLLAGYLASVLKGPFFFYQVWVLFWLLIGALLFFQPSQATMNAVVVPIVQFFKIPDGQYSISLDLGLSGPIVGLVALAFPLAGWMGSKIIERLWRHILSLRQEFGFLAVFFAVETSLLTLSILAFFAAGHVPVSGIGGWAIGLLLALSVTLGFGALMAYSIARFLEAKFLSPSGEAR